LSECAGTETGFSHTHADARHRYADYRAMYSNCTHVQNNLEIVYLDDDDDYDLGFLSDIREVYGLDLGASRKSSEYKSKDVRRGEFTFLFQGKISALNR